MMRYFTNVSTLIMVMTMLVMTLSSSCVIMTCAFAPPSTKPLYRPATLVTAAKPTRNNHVVVGGYVSSSSSAKTNPNSLLLSKTVAFTMLQMVKDDDDDNNKQGKVSNDGTFYDDERDSAPIKQGLSDSMKARLMAEASTGLDSDSKQDNVLLYIILGVAVLVVLGGAGIFY